jgi:FAD:protein FMN transferase
VFSAAFEAGGDKVFSNPPPGKVGWRVETDCPGFRVLRLSNCAVGISGDTEQFLRYKDVRLSHVIDPESGWGSASERTCLVVAKLGILSDPLSTIGTLMAVETYADFVEENYPEACFAIYSSPNQIENNAPRIDPP